MHLFVYFSVVMFWSQWHLKSRTLTFYYTICVSLLRTATFKAYRAILVRRFNFRHQASPRESPRESTQGRKVELWARNVR